MPDITGYRILPDIKFHRILDNTGYQLLPDTGFRIIQDTGQYQVSVARYVECQSLTEGVFDFRLGRTFLYS